MRTEPRQKLEEEVASTVASLAGPRHASLSAGLPFRGTRNASSHASRPSGIRTLRRSHYSTH